MDSLAVDNLTHVKASPQRESPNERLQRELDELRRRVEEYRAHLIYVEAIFDETQLTIKRLQSKAELQCIKAREDAIREAKLSSELTEMKKKLEKMKGAISTPLRKVEEISDSTKNAAKYTFASQAIHFVKIGCVVVLDSVAAYTLFCITKPFVF